MIALNGIIRENFLKQFYLCDDIEDTPNVKIIFDHFKTDKRQLTFLWHIMNAASLEKNDAQKSDWTQAG